MARWDVWTHVVGFGRRVWGLIFVDHKFFNWLLIWGDVGTLDTRKLHCQANFEPRKLQGDSRVVQGLLLPAQLIQFTKIGIGWSIVRLVVLFRSLPPKTKIEIYWGLSSQWMNNISQNLYKVVTPPVRYLSWVLNSLNYFGLSSINPTTINHSTAKKRIHHPQI